MLRAYYDVNESDSFDTLFDDEHPTPEKCGYQVMYLDFSRVGVNRLTTHRRHWKMRKARAVIALTEGDAEEWRKINPHVKVIPNVVNLNNTGRLSDCSSKNVIFVGRYSKQKDVWSLLKIWQLVHQRHPDWTLNLFGDYGDQRDVLLPEIKKTGANIVLHDPTAKIGEEYLRSRMGAAGVQSSQRYSAENIMPMWKELFDLLCSQEP